MPTLSVTQPLCEYRKNPLGIDVTQPRLGWKLACDRRGVKQTAYQVLAATAPDLLSEGQADLWDSGKVETDRSIHVVYGGQPPSSRQRVHWRVTAWDDAGETAESENAWFEMGLLESSDWQARWIGAALTGGPRSNVPIPFLRKSFEVTQAVKRARLYATAVGVYECSLNGKTVGEDVLAPGWTDYHERLRYQVYDVTDLVKEGDNALGALLGDGWAVGFVGISNRQQYFDKAGLLVQLELTLEDGTVQTVVSDEGWKHQFGPIVESDLLMGEAYDARLELPGWDAPGFDDSGWLNVETYPHSLTLVATNGPLVRRVMELTPSAPVVAKHDLLRKRDIVDLGQNMVGRVRFRGSAPRGTTVVFRFAEVLDENGDMYTANLRSARATDAYTFKGEGEEVWESKFTFHGFRYVELSGYPGEVTADTITGVVLYSDMAQTGHFECSDPLLNQLQSNIVWGQRGNFLDVPTDCPQRDERLGWTGDIQVFARTAAFNMDVAGFMTKWARDVRDAQNDAGAVPAVVPNASITLPDGGPAWADAAVICPWTVYQCYGDTRILEENYDVMSRFMDFLLRTSPDHIRCAPGYEGWMGFGDWLSINADTPRDLIGTAFLAYDARLMAQIADVLGKKEEAARYEALFEEVKKAFQNRFLEGGTLSGADAAALKERRDMNQADAISRGNLQAVDYGEIDSDVFNTELFRPTQTSYVLALHFDLLPEGLRPIAAKELVEDIKRRDMHLSTGFVGAPYLPHVLSHCDELEVAYALLNQQTWPSWLYSVTQGGTTIWERWDGWTKERGFQSTQMNSFNHYAYGSIGTWLYQTVAGLDIGKAGYKHALIKPQPGDSLSYAKASLETPYGNLSSAWALEEGRFRLELRVPANTTATIYLPRADAVTSVEHDAPDDLAFEEEGASLVTTLGSGHYTFSYPLTSSSRS